jgi:hypothetical protein
VNVETQKQRAPNGASSPSATRTPQKSLLGRTLFIAGVFALLAMIYVPTPHRGYRLIFSQGDTSIAFSQLLLNVGFAALLGAILAISKRARWASGCIVLVAIACFVAAGIGKRAWLKAEAEERYADASFVPPYSANEIVRAQEHFRNAAVNWRLALQVEKAESAEARASGAAIEMNATQMRVAREEFTRQWKINADRVVESHPELGYENSLYSRAITKVLNSNLIYSQRVDGFELAYKVIMRQLPPPGGLLPETEFYRLLDHLKTDPPAEKVNSYEKHEP